MLLTSPKGDVTIRPAGPADAAALRELRLEALQRHPQAFSADYEVAITQPAEFWAERLEQNLAQNSAATFVAVAGGQCVGLCGIVRGNSSKTRHAGMIWGVYVQDAWRGAHISDGLIGACLAWARTQELAVVRLGVVTTNAAAIRCYVRCGFAVYGVEPQSVRWDGVFYDELLMARRP